MDNKPLISIITATYNSQNTLDKFINSIVNQSYKNFELIIIDGASKDNTIDIIKQHSDHIIKWISEKDNGVYDAWNKGLTYAKGDWITFIGSDDELYHDALENYIDFINNSQEQYDLISSRIHIINDNNDIVRTLGWPWEWKKSRKVFTIAHPGALHKKDLFSKFGNFNTMFKICGDYDFLLRCGEDMKAGFMNKVTLRMALGGLSDTHAVLKETYKILRVTSKLNYIDATYIYTLQSLKYFIRKGFRQLGLNIALKK